MNGKFLFSSFLNEKHQRAYKFVGEFFIRKHVTGGKQNMCSSMPYTRYDTELAFIKLIFARLVRIIRVNKMEFLNQQ